MPEPEDDAPDLDDLGDLGDPDDDDADDETDDEEEFVPLTKEETAKLRAKVERQEARITRLVGKDRRGRPAKDVDKELSDQLKGKGQKDDEPEPADDGRLVRAAGIAALVGAGLTKAQAKSAVRLMDLRDVEVDEDGDADLEDEVDDLKEKFPGLFERTVGYRRPPASRRTPERTRAELTPTEKTDRALLRSAGFKV